MPDAKELSRRERQIMDAIYELGQATVAEIRERVPEPPSYSAVRAMIVRLEDKGHLRHKEQGPRYLYQPVVRLSRARESATKRLLGTFFEGSTVKAVSAIVSHMRLPTTSLTVCGEGECS